MDMRIAMRARQRLHGLEAIRFFAALMIILFHLVHLPSLALPDYLAFIGKYFAIGVPLFYVVSAFGLFLGYRGRTATRDELRELGCGLPTGSCIALGSQPFRPSRSWDKLPPSGVDHSSMETK